MFTSESIALQGSLGAVLGRSWAASTSKIVLWPTRRSFFQKSHFSQNRTWKPNLAAKSAENDPKMAPQNDPKSTKNRCQKTIEILIENNTNFVIHFGRPGGMRWPPGGIIGGAKNSLFELCKYLNISWL